MFNKIYYFNNHQGDNHSSSVGRARSLYYGNIDLSRWFESSWEQILIYVKLVFLRFSTDYIMQENCSAKSIENCSDLLEIFWTVSTQNFKSWPRADSEIWMDEARSLILGIDDTRDSGANLCSHQPIILTAYWYLKSANNLK